MSGRATPRCATPRSRAHRAGALLAAVACFAFAAAQPALAQRGDLPIVRDAEAEELLREYADPIFRAAGLGAARPEIILVDSDQFNAFVADNRRIIVTAGVLEQSETPNEVIGVLAHEVGHLAGHHLARMREAIARARLIAAISALAGVGAMAAGAATGSADFARGGAAIIAGGGSSAKRGFLAYQRGEESAADAAALTYLERTGQSARGMLTTFQRMADEQLFSAKYADPYALTHPVARDRLTHLEKRARASPHFDKKDPPGLQLRHDMVRAKLIAFTKHPRTVLRRFPRTDDSLPARYARAIADYRSAKPRQAQQAIDALIASDRGNPYFWELKGQAWLEAGEPRRAIEPLVQAVSLAPHPGLIRIMLGHAMVSTGDPNFLPVAIRELRRGLKEEPNVPIGYRALGLAYARSGNPGQADLASAHAMMIAGDAEEAKRYAARAQQNLKHGSPGWLQADDILAYQPPRLSQR